jgi:hypothetical protein
LPPLGHGSARPREIRSFQDYAHDTLMNAVNARIQRRNDVLDHVVRVSEGLNKWNRRAATTPSSMATSDSPGTPRGCS